MSRNYPESELHKTVKKYLDLILTPDSWWTSIDHAAKGKFRGQMRRARGVKKGIPDILILFAGRCHWIELKSPDGKLSPEQKDCHEAIVSAGGAVTVARSVDHVSDALARWQVPTRERKAARLPFRVLPQDEVEAA
jgi:hypothetical protein